MRNVRSTYLLARNEPPWPAGRTPMSAPSSCHRLRPGGAGPPTQLGTIPPALLLFAIGDRPRPLPAPLRPTLSWLALPALPGGLATFVLGDPSGPPKGVKISSRKRTTFSSSSHRPEKVLLGAFCFVKPAPGVVTFDFPQARVSSQHTVGNLSEASVSRDFRH